jgi:hypothetical protein
MAPAAGAMTNQSAIVASSAVPYPNGLIPTLFERIPAKIIISHALRKKNPPAAGNEKNGLTLYSPFTRGGKPSPGATPGANVTCP